MRIITIFKFSFIIIPLSLLGCIPVLENDSAPHTNKIDFYVSSQKYNHYNCNELRELVLKIDRLKTIKDVNSLWGLDAISYVRDIYSRDSRTTDLDEKDIQYFYTAARVTKAIMPAIGIANINSVWDAVRYNACEVDSSWDGRS